MEMMDDGKETFVETDVICNKENNADMKDVDLKMYKLECENKQLNEHIKMLNERYNNTQKIFKGKEKLHAKEVDDIKVLHSNQLNDLQLLNKNLQFYIDKQETHIQKIQREKGGEEAEIMFNFTNSLQPFITQIDELKKIKIDLTQRNLSLENEKNKLKILLTSLEKSVTEEYSRKEDLLLLQKHNELLESELNLAKMTATPSKILPPPTNIKQVELLRKQLQERNTEYSENLTNANTEVRSLKKKLRNVENKCTSLMYTPPKVRVRTVVDEDTERELDEVKKEKIELQFQLRRFKREHEEKMTSYEEDVLKLKDQLKLTVDETSNYKEQLSNYQQEKEEHLMVKKEITDIKEKLVISEKQLDKLKLDAVKQISKHEEELKLLRVEITLDMESKQTNIMSASSKKIMSQTIKQLKELVKLKNQVEHDVNTMINELPNAFNDIQNKLLKQVSTVSSKSSLLAERYNEEIKLRKKLHNELVELKGNIRVLCRVRPIIDEDGEESIKTVQFDQEDDGILFINHKATQKQFHMDKVFAPQASQDQVFDDVRSLVNSCLDGYNVCIFAYGQTGSGKTYTMEGTTKNPGMNQKALHLLFNEASNHRDWDYTILVSYMEIYNEMLRDLLSVDPTSKLEIKQSLKDVIINVPGLTCVPVRSVKDVNDILKLGRHNRMTAATDMNERSSRSHSILSITVLGRNTITNTEINGKLNLVDLAGSERLSKSGVSGVRMKEAQSINKSLSALGDVIHALKNKDKHIPYRNTKLTYLLQDSLGGDSKTLMVVQISPASINASETLCSLNFAQRVRAVELGKPSLSKRKDKS